MAAAGTLNTLLKAKGQDDLIAFLNSVFRNRDAVEQVRRRGAVPQGEAKFRTPFFLSQVNLVDVQAWFSLTDEHEATNVRARPCLTDGHSTQRLSPHRW